MTVRELIELLQDQDQDLDVFYTSESQIFSPLFVVTIDEHRWLPDPKDKIGKSYQSTGRKIVVME